MPLSASIALAGRVLFPDGTEHDCTVRCAEAAVMEVEVPHAVACGERLICHVDGLGVVEGLAGVTAPLGHYMHVLGTPSHLSRLSARIDWHRRRAAGEEDQRGQARFVPWHSEVKVRLASGQEVYGALIDLSATGAALRLSVLPDVGAPVVVGRRHATVVRHLDDGIALRFKLPLRPQDVGPAASL